MHFQIILKNPCCEDTYDDEPPQVEHVPESLSESLDEPSESDSELEESESDEDEEDDRRWLLLFLTDGLAG